MQHPSENPTNVGLSNYVFLTGQGESIGQMLKMVYDTIKSMGNNYASYYVIKSYYDSAKSMFSGMLQITASYRMAGENNLTYLQHKQDCTYLNFHFMEISKAYGFVY